MAEIVRMPKLSDTMTEGVVAEWHKNIGDPVVEGDLLAEIETDKATMEFESFYDGTLLHIGVEKGGAAPVNAVLAVIGEKGEDFSTLIKDTDEEKPGAEPTPSSSADEAVSKEDEIEKLEKSVETEISRTDNEITADSNGQRVFASPLAKKIAADKGINIANVTGSGDGGRVIKRDVEHFSASSAPRIQHTAAAEESYTDVPNSQMRKAIAKALTASKFSAPHFYLKMEVRMDNAIKARKEINAKGEVKISFNDLVVKAVAMALRKHPKVNADWMGDFIRYNNHVNVGVAVAVDEGLVVPIVRHTDTKGVALIGHEIKDLAKRAREKKIQPNEMEGGTFAVSNLGMYGIEDFTSIINPPNGCILSVGQIKETAVVNNGQIKIGNIMKLSLSCDHRVVDGAVGSEFLNTLKDYLENPVMMLV